MVTPPRGDPDLSGLLPKYYDMTQVPGGWVSGRSDKPDQHPGSLFHRYMWDTIVILLEGNRPYPQCPKCDMFIAK